MVPHVSHLQILLQLLHLDKYAIVLKGESASTQCLHLHMCYVYLLRCAEDVSIVLAEPANASETSQCSRELITM